MSTILLLDDDRIFRRLVQVALEPKGYRVLEAGRGSDADRLLAAEKPDLVVLDGLLPDTTGVAWLAKCRQAGSVWPVLFVTSFWKTLREFHMVTRTLGAVDLLRKPIEPQALVARLDAVLAGFSVPVLPG